MNGCKGHVVLGTFAGMFFWWASIVLYWGQRREGIEVYLLGLLPVLPLCLVLGWVIDRFGIIKSWRVRAAAGYGLNWLAQITWFYSTEEASFAKGIRLGTWGPFVLGAMAVSWVNLFILVIILLLRGYFTRKGNKNLGPRSSNLSSIS
jgi:hypothetical protein